MDIGHQETDSLIEKTERKIRRIYLQAQSEVQKKLEGYLAQFKTKDAEMAKQVAQGKITEKEYLNWRRNQICMGERWKDMVDTLTQDYVNADKIAMSIINGYTPDAYALNHNFATYQIEKGSMLDTSYTLYDRHTVERLLRENPQLLPEAKVNIPKDTRWNRRHINNAVTQGILQGESIGKVAYRLRKVTDMDNAAAIRNARTMITGAQNAGRLDSYERAGSLGIKMKKEWLATLDGRTRHSHRQLDGVRVAVDDKFPNGCKYPGDPYGPGMEVYNCRCTMVAAVEGVNQSNAPRNSRLGSMSYDEWKNEHSVKQVQRDAENDLERITKDTLNKARENEITTTAALRNSINGTDATLDGLDFRLKSESSLMRKIHDKSIKKGMSQEEYARTVTDALRYTVKSPTGSFTNNYFVVMDSLEKRGYGIVEVVNTLKLENAPYRGINTLMRTPSGYVFELQFHTEESLAIKEINHLLYEEQRLLTTPLERQRELNIIMMNNARSIPTPPGVDKISDKTH